MVEDIPEPRKLTEIMKKLSMSPQKKMDERQLGFGTVNPAANPNMLLADQHDARTIAASGSKRVYMKVDLSGLLSQHRWNCTHWAGRACRFNCLWLQQRRR